MTCRLPKLEVIGEGTEQDIEISDDPYDTLPLDVSNVPILITLNKVFINLFLPYNSFLQLINP